MIDQTQLKQFHQHVRDGLRKVPRARYYAVEGPSLDALAFIGIAWLEARVETGSRFSGEAFQQFLSELVRLVPLLRQHRPEEPPPLSHSWVDPVTKQPAKNPW